MTLAKTGVAMARTFVTGLVDPSLHQALPTTVDGIAAGLHDTGRAARPATADQRHRGTPPVSVLARNGEGMSPGGAGR